MFYFLPQSYENNLKAQCFCYKKNDKSPAIHRGRQGCIVFLYFYKDYNTAAFFTGSGISTAKIRRKTEICREIQRKTEKFRENRRKTRNHL